MYNYKWLDIGHSIHVRGRKRFEADVTQKGSVKSEYANKTSNIPSIRKHAVEENIRMVMQIQKTANLVKYTEQQQLQQNMIF